MTAGSQTSVAVASGGPGSFVVWRDLRNPTADIYGARVLPDGTVLDPGGFVVSSAPFDQSFPVAAYDGQDYVVVWQHAQGSGPNDLYGARVHVDGTVLDSSGFPIAVDPSDELAPRLSAGSSGHLLLVYQRMDTQAPYGTQRVRARLLTTSDEPPDAGTPDAGVPDAGPPDAGDPDAGPPEMDAGVFDAGSPEMDAGVSDAGTPESDAGTPDSGSDSDAGAADAGSPESDAGPLDGGDSNPGIPDAGGADAGGPDAGPPVDVPEPCGCTSSGSSPGLFLGCLLIMLARRRRPGFIL